MSEQAPEIQAGRVGRAHGLDGSFYVTGARSRLLSLGATVSVAGRAREIVRRSGTEERPILRLAGIEQRTAAEELRGQSLTAAQEGAPALSEGEWWAHELEGCAVLDAGGRALGSVGRLLELPSCEVLEVQRAGGEPLLVPMVKDAILAVDAAGRRIEVNGDFLGLDDPPASAQGEETAPAAGDADAPTHDADPPAHDPDAPAHDPDAPTHDTEPMAADPASEEQLGD